LRNAVGDHTVDADRGQEQSEPGENSEQEHVETRLRELQGEKVVHGLKPRNEEVLVHAPHGIARGEVEPAQLRPGEAQDEIEAAGDVLRERQVKLRCRCGIERLVSRIANHSDDLQRTGFVRPAIEEDLLSDGIALSEEMARESPINDGDQLRVSVVVRREDPAAQERNLHCIKVIWCHGEPAGALMFAARSRCFAAQCQRGETRVAAKRERIDAARKLDAGNGGEFRFDRLKGAKLFSFILLVTRARETDLRSHEPVRNETGIGCA
jgi:hypothetical protein